MHLNALRTMLGHQKPIATCSLHVKENARKKCKTVWNENYFWRLQQARSRRERDAAWAAIERAFPPAAITISTNSSSMIYPIMVALGRDSLSYKKKYARSVEMVFFKEAYRFSIPGAQ